MRAPKRSSKKPRKLTACWLIAASVSAMIILAMQAFPARPDRVGGLPGLAASKTSLAIFLVLAMCLAVDVAAHGAQRHNAVLTCAMISKSPWKKPTLE